MPERISSFKDLRVYKLVFELQQEVFETSKQFPVEERYALTDQSGDRLDRRISSLATFSSSLWMTKPPVLIDGLALLSGYCWATIRRVERCVTPELMRFHRREQRQKLRAIFRSILRFKKVDNFSLMIDETH